MILCYTSYTNYKTNLESKKTVQNMLCAKNSISEQVERFLSSVSYDERECFDSSMTSLVPENSNTGLDYRFESTQKQTNKNHYIILQFQNKNENNDDLN